MISSKRATTLRVAWLLVSVVFGAGCVSQVWITSEPSGAKVFNDGAYYGRTPTQQSVTWRLFKKNQVELDCPGYRPLHTTLRRGFSQRRYVPSGHVGYQRRDISRASWLPFSWGPKREQHFELAKASRPSPKRAKPRSSGKASSNGRLVNFASILASNKAIAKPIIEFQNRAQEAKKRLVDLESKQTMFLILGKIMDRDEHKIQVLGEAIPEGRSNAFGALWEKSNIVVQNPDEGKILGPNYSGGKHYFLRKDYGKNAFGVRMPIWVYGDMPPIVRIEQQNWEELLGQMKQKRLKFFRRILGGRESIAKHKKKAEDAFAELSSVLKSLNSFRGFSIGNKQIRLSSIYNLADHFETIGGGYYFFFARDGVIIISDGVEVVAITYMLQADVLTQYFPFLRRYGVEESFRSKIPLNTPLISRKDLVRRSKRGVVSAINPFLPELIKIYIKPKKNNAKGYEYRFTSLTDGENTAILAVTVLNLKRAGSGLRYLPFASVRADRDPILGKEINH